LVLLPRVVFPLAALLLLSVSHACAQGDLRVTHTVERKPPDQIEVSGRVINEGRLHATHVVLTVYALDGGGNVTARANANVGSVPERDATPFLVRLNVGADYASVRATVTSYRMSIFQQGP
jgi:hypothetical protein